MKNLALLLVGAFIMILSSCYVEVDGGVHRHHPFWHHRHAVIVGENKVPSKSVQTDQVTIKE